MARERVAAGTIGSSRKTAALERLLAEGIRRLERRLSEAKRGVRRRQSHVLKACLVHPRERSAAIRKRLPWRGYSPDGEHLDHRRNSAQPGMGCKAGKGRGRSKPRRAIAALRVRVNVWPDPSRLSYDDSRPARPGQGDTWRDAEFQEGGDGDRCQGCTGPRGRTLGEDQTRLVSQSGVTSE
jgi:hypothetical protein